MPTMFEEMVIEGKITFTFGEIFRKIRKDAGLKPIDIAKRYKTSTSAVSQWENNINRPDDFKVADFAEWCNVPIAVFPDRQGVPMSTCTQRSAGTVVPIRRPRRTDRNRTPSTKPFQPRLAR